MRDAWRIVCALLVAGGVLAACGRSGSQGTDTSGSAATAAGSGSNTTAIHGRVVARSRAGRQPAPLAGVRVALLGPTLHSTKTDDKGEFRFATAGPTYDLVAIEQRGTDAMDVVVFRGLRRRDPTVSLEPHREARELGDERPYSTATIDHPSSREMICRTSFVAKSPHGMPDWFSSTVQRPGHAPLRGTAASVCQRLGAQSEFLFAREELSLSARQPAALPLSLYKPLATRQLTAALTAPNGMRRDTLESFMRLAPGVWLQIDAALEDETTIIAPRDPQAKLIVRASAVGRGLVTRGWREVSNADTVSFALPEPPAPEMPPSGDVDVLPGTRFAWSAGPRGPYRVEIELNYRASGQLDGELSFRERNFGVLEGRTGREVSENETLGSVWEARRAKFRKVKLWGA